MPLISHLAGEEYDQKNYYDFANTLYVRTLIDENNSFMSSLDIISLYTEIPIAEL